MKLIGYEAQTALIVRLSALRALEAKLKECAEREQRLQEALMELVPKKLRPLFEQEDILKGLLGTGRYVATVYFACDRDVCGFKNEKEVKAALKTLAKVWKNNVTIHFGLTADCTVDVHFGIAQL